MGVELKPCPFCGGTAHVEQPGTRRQSCVVECDSCGIRHESGDEGSMCGTAWNRREGEAARIQQQALDYVSLFDQCSQHLARIAALERKYKEAFDDCGELNTANHELLAACGEKDRRIAELEKERDALKMDSERYDFLRCRAELREYSMGLYWYIKTVDVPMGMPLMDATLANVIDAALQAEKETRS